MRAKMLTLSQHKEHIMKTVISRLLLLCALLCAAGTMTAKTGEYKSFKVSIYVRAYEVDKMKDMHWLDST